MPEKEKCEPEEGKREVEMRSQNLTWAIIAGADGQHSRWALKMRLTRSFSDLTDRSNTGSS